MTDMTDNVGVMGYTWCIIETDYKLQKVGMQKLKQAEQNGFLTLSLILSVPLTLSHSLFSYLVLALRATD